MKKKQEQKEKKETAIVFVDANNWYHNLKHIIPRAGYVDIRKVSKLVCEHFNLDLKGIRWYASIPDIKDGAIMYHKHMEHLTKLENKGIRVVTRKLQKSSNKEILQQKKDLIESLELCNLCKPIVKSNCMGCIGKHKKKEKGIDVWAAIDVVRKVLVEKGSDTAILLSGDSDFIPVFELLQAAGKTAYSASVYPGYSRELRASTKFLILNQTHIKKCLHEYAEEKAYFK